MQKRSVALGIMAAMSVVVAFVVFGVAFCYPYRIAVRWYWLGLGWYLAASAAVGLLSGAKRRWIWGVLTNAPIIGFVMFLLPVNWDAAFLNAFVLPLLGVLVLELLIVLLLPRILRRTPLP